MSCKSRNQILSELFTSKEFNDCISKMNPEHLQEDLKAEVALILCELDEKKLTEIYKTGGLKFYAARIILNLIQSNTSPFYKKYRQVFNRVSETAHEDEDDQINTEVKNYISILIHDEDIDLRLSKEQLEQKIMEFVNELYWYDAEILRLYLTLGSYREIEKETGIRWTSCYDTVQTAIGILKSKLRQNAITTPVA